MTNFQTRREGFTILVESVFQLISVFFLLLPFIVIILQQYAVPVPVCLYVVVRWQFCGSICFAEIIEIKWETRLNLNYYLKHFIDGQSSDACNQFFFIWFHLP